MTPSEHRTLAESLMATPPAVTGNAHFSYATAHAILGQAAGTGAHYATADNLLAEAETYRENGRLQQSFIDTVREALVYAHLATRA